MKSILIKGSLILFLLLPGIAPAGQDELNVALCNALIAGDLGAVKAALKKGADPKTYCLTPGKTSLFDLDKFIAEATMEALYFGGDKAPAIHFAPEKPEFIEALAKAGADINAYCGGIYTTILTKAIAQKDIPYIRFLIRSGADVNRKDPDTGVTPLYWGVVTKDLKVVEVIVESGADVNAEIADGTTILEAAEKVGKKDVVDFLKQRGAARGSGSPSQKAHAGSKKTAGGFRDLKWGTRLSNYPGQFTPHRDKPHIYTRKADSLFFGQAKLEHIDYHFYRGRLVAIYTGTKGLDNQKPLIHELEAQYGPLKYHPGRPGKYFGPNLDPKEGTHVELSCAWEEPRAAGERYTPHEEEIIEEKDCTLFIKDVKGYQDYVLRKK